MDYSDYGYTTTHRLYIKIDPDFIYTQYLESPRQHIRENPQENFFATEFWVFQFLRQNSMFAFCTFLFSILAGFNGARCFTFSLFAYIIGTTKNYCKITTFDVLILGPLIMVYAAVSRFFITYVLLLFIGLHYKNYYAPILLLLVNAAGYVFYLFLNIQVGTMTKRKYAFSLSTQDAFVFKYIDHTNGTNHSLRGWIKKYKKYIDENYAARSS